MLTLPATPTHAANAAVAADAATWLAARVRGHLRTDSRSVEPGDAFIAWPGHTQDARRHVAAALAAGAAACLVEADGVEAFNFSDDRIAAVQGLKSAAGAVAHAYFAQPSAVLDMVAATGTNGKTSTTWWTAQALTALGRRCGLVGTLGVGEPPQILIKPVARPVVNPAINPAAAPSPMSTLTSTGLTTPDAVSLHAALRAFVDQGYTACAMEASSIGLTEGRLNAVQISVALFTNLSQDHLDHHGSMAAYWDAKRQLFSWPGLRAAVINIDDEHGAKLALELTARMAAAKTTSALDLFTVSLHQPARLQAHALRYDNGGLTFEVTEGPNRVTVASQLVGDFNANNLLVVLGGLRALGVPLAQAAQVLGQVTPVPGRLQRVVPHGALNGARPSDAVVGSDHLDGTSHDSHDSAAIDVLVDYAHTPDALEKTLQALRPLAAARGGRLWCVFGCGGDRDNSKRPLMGGIAAREADWVVLTSDNPRSEVPAAILAQIQAGVPASQQHNVVVIEDRRQAIHHAMSNAAAGDVVLLAGKGHETTQEVAGVKRPFSDVDEARAALLVRQSRGGAPVATDALDAPEAPDAHSALGAHGALGAHDAPVGKPRPLSFRATAC
jgi:MurE/MurF fusion protein